MKDVLLKLFEFFLINRLKNIHNHQLEQMKSHINYNI